MPGTYFLTSDQMRPVSSPSSNGWNIPLKVLSNKNWGGSKLASGFYDAHSERIQLSKSVRRLLTVCVWFVQCALWGGSLAIFSSGCVYFVQYNAHTEKFSYILTLCACMFAQCALWESIDIFNSVCLLCSVRTLRGSALDIVWTPRDLAILYLWGSLAIVNSTCLLCTMRTLRCSAIF